MTKYVVVTELRTTIDVEVDADSLEEAIAKVKNEKKLHDFLKKEIIVNDGRIDVSGVLNQEINYEKLS